MKFFKKILSIFKPLAKIFVDALAESIAKNGGPVLIAAAKDGILAAEASGGSSSEKFQIAKDVIAARLTSEGIPIVSSAINGAIEAALADYKRNH